MPATILHPDGSVRDDDMGGVNGYVLMEAASLEGALQAAQACLRLDAGGTPSVQEIVAA